jgi:hypothetical protein
MNLKKSILLTALVIGGFCMAYSQNYKSAIGLRLGYPVSVTYKHFISDPGAIEVFAGFRTWEFYSWINIGGLYQHHNPISGVDGLQWYFGGGASVFFWNYKNNFADSGSNTSVGILGVLGLDYKFDSAPVNLSVDWVPTFFVNGYGSGFGGGYGAFSARYTLN